MLMVREYSWIHCHLVMKDKNIDVVVITMD